MQNNSYSTSFLAYCKKVVCIQMSLQYVKPYLYVSVFKYSAKDCLGSERGAGRITSAKVLYPVASEWQAGRWKLVEAAQHGPCVALKHLVQVNGDAHGFMDGASSSAMCWV